MNDLQIRTSFHKKKLQRHHANADTLVLDELGLMHGRYRADIAVINGHIIGYEIKSDEDTFYRLDDQITAYDAVFDKATLVVGERHAMHAKKLIPEWWGLIVSIQGMRGAISFETMRKARANENLNPVSLAQLLWRDEVVGILLKQGFQLKELRKPRAALYQILTENLTRNALRLEVRTCLKTRKDWRGRE